jgi:hypothetical protein
MAFDSSGNFTRNTSWQAEAAAGTKILASNHDSHDTDLANAISMMICKDGTSSVLADIPWGNHKITGLKDPDAPQDAATRHFVEQARSFSTGLDISGTNTNGRLTFSGPSGTNGISWTAADLFWGARTAVTNQSPNRLVLNDKADATGTDYLNIDEIGVIGAPAQISLSTNAHRVGGDWRTPVPGTATVFQLGNGSAQMYTNIEPTDTAHDVATMHPWWSTAESDGSVNMVLNKSASEKTADIYGQMEGKNRWLVRLGNETAETETDREGSAFYISSYDNAGTTAVPAMHIMRSDNSVNFYGSSVHFDSSLVSGDGDCSFAGVVRGSHFIAGIGSPGTAVLGTASGIAGNVHLRPLGYDSTTAQAIVAADGALFISGAAYKPGGGSWLATSDARVKDVQGDYTQGLDAVLALNPVIYTYKDKAYSAAIHVGLVAQEAEAVMPELVTQAKGVIDGKEVPDLRSLDATPLIYALVNAVKELTARIEALEGAAA